jgi:hypothetical protein
VNKGGLAIIHKRTFSQICLQVREKSLKVYELYYIPVTCYNVLSKYAEFKIYFLIM